MPAERRGLAGAQQAMESSSCEPAAQQRLQEPLRYPKRTLQVQLRAFSALFQRGREEAWVTLAAPTQPCCAQPMSSCHWDWHSLFDGLLAVLHQQPDGRGCCVELGHLVLVNDAPHSPDIWVGGDTFKLSRRQSSDSCSSLLRTCSTCPSRRSQTAAGPQHVLIGVPRSETSPGQGPPLLPPWDGGGISPPQVS